MDDAEGCVNGLHEPNPFCLWFSHLGGTHTTHPIPALQFVFLATVIVWLF